MYRGQERATLDALSAERSLTEITSIPSSIAERAAGDLYFNRELSWLTFNERVLAEAGNPAHPLLERLRFLSISGSNLDEFLMIRVAGLAGQVRRGVTRLSIDGKTPSQELAAIEERVREVHRGQQAILSQLKDLLASEGIAIARGDEIDGEADLWLERFFLDRVMPVITPQAIDPGHPFPFIANKGIGTLFGLRRVADGSRLVEMVLIPTAIPRFVRVPGARATYVAIEHIVERFAHLLFPGFRVEGTGSFRVLRDSDIEIEEDAEDLVRYFRSAIQRRRRGRVILLELEESFDDEGEELLRDELDLSAAMIVKTSGLLGISGLADIVAEDRPELKFAPHTPRYPERILEHDGDCFAAIRKKDILIHHPYETFEAVVDFLHQAAADPAVVSIKQTLYRAGNQSPVINALIDAADAGKSVTAVVELKARFDEEQNLKWASALEQAGVQVIYGFVDWKTHAKVSMVVRQEGEEYRTYCHFGTGNYHPVTARLYTDLSFFTAEPALARDAGRLFNFVTGYVDPQTPERLAISPLNMRETLYELIDREIEHARAGRPATIWAKLNALTERGIIDRLYQAGQAGVEVVLVVRGICCLRPGIEGLSETIVVKSIIGRFLEHSRIWAFGNGKKLPSGDAQVYISSADAMGRSFERRVEIMVPILNRTVHAQVLEQVMLANLLDTRNSWLLDGHTGDYHRMDAGEDGFDCHEYFMTNPSLSGRGQALAESGVPKLSLRSLRT